MNVNKNNSNNSNNKSASTNADIQNCKDMS